MIIATPTCGLFLLFMVGCKHYHVGVNSHNNEGILDFLVFIRHIKVPLCFLMILIFDVISMVFTAADVV